MSDSENKEKNTSLESDLSTLRQSTSVEYIMGTVSGVTGAVTIATGAAIAGVTYAVAGVASGVSQVKHDVGGAVSSVTSGVSSNVGEAVNQVSSKVFRYLTLPPQQSQEEEPAMGQVNNNTPQGKAESSGFTEDNRGVVMTPRASHDSGISSSFLITSTDQQHSRPSYLTNSEEEEETDSLLEEDVSVCKELGVTQSMLDGDKSEVTTRLTSLEQRVKELILDTSPGTSRRRVLVHTLVAVREHLLKLNDVTQTASEMGGASIKGHLLLPNKGKRKSCDVCTHTIWDIITPAYMCSACRLHVHWSCKEDIRRYCPASYFTTLNSPQPSHPDDMLLTLPLISGNASISTDALFNSSNLTLSDLNVKTANINIATNVTPTSSYPNTPSDVSSVTTTPSSSYTNNASFNINTSPSNISPSSTSTKVPHTPSPSKHSIKSLQNLAALTSASTEYSSISPSVKSSKKTRSLLKSPLTSVITKICPEVGLGAQDFKCAECRQLITNRSAWSEPRICNYSGLYYCPACHWSNLAVLPSLIIRNWDFTQRSVSRCSYQLLNYIREKPLLDIEELNPHLFVFVQEICEVKKMREDLMSMKQYLCSCRTATEAKLLRRLSSRQHFVDSPKLYSVKDLLDINNGSLLKELQAVHDEFSKHITKDCLVCQGRGHICLNCKDADDILYPFDTHAVRCSSCYSVMHTDCYTTKRTCAKCVKQGKQGPATIIGALMDVKTTPVLSGSSHNSPKTKKKKNNKKRNNENC